MKIKIKPLTTSNGRPTQYGLLGPNLVPRVFRLFGQMGNAGKTVPLTKQPEDSGYEIGMSSTRDDLSLSSSGGWILLKR